MTLLDGILNLEVLEPKHNPDMCGCSNCGWKGKCSDCKTDWESEGWEYPEYQIHLCPVCDDGGCIDDYWYSEDEEEVSK